MVADSPTARRTGPTPPPRVSIVTPTFQHAPFIEGCIRSVLAQDYAAWEMIVVDDASVDGTAEIVQRYAREDPRIRLVRHAENWGAGRLPETYNEALALARGELVAVLEGDDEWVPGKLSRQIPVFDDLRVVLSYGDYAQLTTDGLVIARHGIEDAVAAGRSTPPEQIRFFSALKSFGANTVMLRRDALTRIGGFVQAGMPLVDYPTWLELATSGDFVRIPVVLGTWRRHPGSVYYAREYQTLELLARHFLDYIERRRVDLLALGFGDDELAALAGNTEHALQDKRRGQRYFEGKYQLLLGNRWKSVPSFGRALVGRGTRPRHRLGALVGLVAAFTSPRLVIHASRLMRPGGRES